MQSIHASSIYIINTDINYSTEASIQLRYFQIDKF